MDQFRVNVKRGLLQSREVGGQIDEVEPGGYAQNTERAQERQIPASRLPPGIRLIDQELSGVVSAMTIMEQGAARACRRLAGRGPDRQDRTASKHRAL